MIPISVKDVTYSKLNVLKTKSILHRKGVSLTWNNIIDALIETSNKNEIDFYSEIEKQHGKQRRN